MLNILIKAGKIAAALGAPPPNPCWPPAAAPPQNPDVVTLRSTTAQISLHR